MQLPHAAVGLDGELRREPCPRSCFGRPTRPSDLPKGCPFGFSGVLPRYRSGEWKPDLNRETPRMRLAGEAPTELAHDHSLEKARAEAGAWAGLGLASRRRQPGGQLLPGEPQMVTQGFSLDRPMDAKLASRSGPGPVLQSVGSELMEYQCQGMGLSLVKAHRRPREVAREI